MQTPAKPQTISTGTFVAGLWLVLCVVGGVLMYPTFMESLARYVQEEHARESPSVGLIASLNPRVIYYVAVAQVVAVGWALARWLQTQMKEAAKTR